MTELKEELSYYLTGNSITELFPINHYDESSDLFYLNKRVGFVLELSPLCGVEEDSLDLLKSFLIELLPEEAILQFTLWGSPRIHGFLNNWSDYRARRGDVFAKLASFRVSYLEKGNTSPIINDEPHVLRDFRILISCSLPNNFDGFEGKATSLRTRLESNLKNIGFSVSHMHVESYLNLLDELLDPYNKDDYLEWQRAQALNEHLANPDYQLVTYPDELIANNDTHISVYTVRQFPKHWAGSGMNELIGSFLRARMQLPCPFLINVLLQKDQVEKSERRCAIKSLRADRMLSTGIAKFLPRMHDVAKEWQQAKHLVDEGERFIKIFYQVITYSKSAQVFEMESSLKDLYTSNGWKLYKDTHICLGAWLSSMPLIPHSGYINELKKLQRFKTMLTKHAVHLLPLQGEYKGGDSPCLLLVGRRGQPLWFDPFDNPHGNYNTTVVGKSGSGKSVLMQDLMTGLAGSGARVFVIDIGRSFQHVCQYLGGEFMEFHYDKPISLNPFSHIQDVRESLELLKPLLGLMISQTRNLSDFENAVLEQAILEVWELNKQETTITKISEYLLRHSDDRAKDLGVMLFPYTNKGMYGSFFKGPCSLNLNSPIIVLELEELKSRKDLQSVVLMLLMYHITEAMYLGNRQEKIACIIDEAWDLFGGQMSAKFIETGARRARKYNGAFISGTQSLNDYFNNPAALAAYENSDNRIFLSHNSSALEAVNVAHDEQLFTPYEISILKTLKTEKGKYSEVFIKSPIGFFVARYYLDPLTQVLYSTTADVHSKLQELLKNGISMEDALTQLSEIQKSLNK